MTPRQRPAIRAPKPNQHERVQRQTVIDNLIGRALRGALTIPEAAVLAEYWAAERRVEEKTRRRLGDTTRALERHRAAADAAILEAEQRAERAETALARIVNLADVWADAPDPLARAMAADLASTIRGPRPAHNAGPTVAEAAAQDRRWWNGEKAGE